jgi:hypothetical protein
MLFEAPVPIIGRTSLQGAHGSLFSTGTCVAAVVGKAGVISKIDVSALFKGVVAANVASQGDDLAVGHDAFVAVA